VKIFKN